MPSNNHTFTKEAHGYVKQDKYEKLIKILDGRSFSYWLREAIDREIEKFESKES